MSDDVKKQLIELRSATVDPQVKATLRQAIDEIDRLRQIRNEIRALTKSMFRATEG